MACANFWNYDAIDGCFSSSALSDVFDAELMVNTYEMFELNGGDSLLAPDQFPEYDSSTVETVNWIFDAKIDDTEIEVRDHIDGGSA